MWVAGRVIGFLLAGGCRCGVVVVVCFGVTMVVYNGSTYTGCTTSTIDGSHVFNAMYLWKNVVVGGRFSGGTVTLFLTILVLIADTPLITFTSNAA